MPSQHQQHQTYPQVCGVLCKHCCCTDCKHSVWKFHEHCRGSHQASSMRVNKPMILGCFLARHLFCNLTVPACRPSRWCCTQQDSAGVQALRPCHDGAAVQLSGSTQRHRRGGWDHTVGLDWGVGVGWPDGRAGGQAVLCSQHAVRLVCESAHLRATHSTWRGSVEGAVTLDCMAIAMRGLT
jgi:hypothetical protein